MIVYVESNFVLEYALLQEQYDSCNRIISLAEAGQVRLVVPAFCVWETLAKVVRNGEERLQFREQLSLHLRELKRAQEYSVEATAFQDELREFLLRSAEVQNTSLHQAFARLASVAEIVPLASEVLIELFRLQTQTPLRVADATVFASVLYHIRSAQRGPRCFVSRDKHFDNPHVKAALEEENCKVIRNFDDAHAFIVNQLGH